MALPPLLAGGVQLTVTLSGAGPATAVTSIGESGATATTAAGTEAATPSRVRACAGAAASVAPQSARARAPPAARRGQGEPWLTHLRNRPLAWPLPMSYSPHADALVRHVRIAPQYGGSVTRQVR